MAGARPAGPDVRRRGLVAVTGGTGFLGRALVEGLRAAGHDVVLLVRPGRPPAGVDGHEIVLPPTVQAATDTITALNPTAVVHLAARHSTDSRDAGAVVDAGLVVGAAAAVAASAVRVPFVHAASYWQYAPNADRAPGSMYVAAKQGLAPLVEYLRAREGLDARELVLYDTYGPGDGRDKVVPMLMKAARDGVTAPLRSRRATIDLTYVDDAAAAFHAAAVARNWPKLCVVRAGKLVSIGSLVARIGDASGRPVPVRYTDPTFRGERKPTGHRWARPPGWTPQVPLAMGLRLTWEGAVQDGARAHERVPAVSRTRGGGAR